ncbi:hypothetical protein ACHAQA_006049 [Verticillium albo-atrum]
MAFPRENMKWNPPSFVDGLPEEKRYFCIKVTDIICNDISLEYFDRLKIIWAIIKSMPDLTYEKLTFKLIIELGAQPQLANDEGILHRLAEIMKELMTPRQVELTYDDNEDLVKEMLGTSVEIKDLAGNFSRIIWEYQLKIETDTPSADKSFIALCSFAGMLVLNGTIDRCDIAIHILMRTLEKRRTSDEELVGASRFLLLACSSIFTQVTAPAFYVTCPVINKMHVGELWNGKLGFSADRWKFWRDHLAKLLRKARLPEAKRYGKLALQHMKEVEKSRAHEGTGVDSETDHALMGIQTDDQRDVENALRAEIRLLEDALARSRRLRYNQMVEKRVASTSTPLENQNRQVERLQRKLASRKREDFYRGQSFAFQVLNPLVRRPLDGVSVADHSISAGQILQALETSSLVPSPLAKRYGDVLDRERALLDMLEAQEKERIREKNDQVQHERQPVQQAVNSVPVTHDLPPNTPPHMVIDGVHYTASALIPNRYNIAENVQKDNSVWEEGKMLLKEFETNQRALCQRDQFVALLIRRWTALKKAAETPGATPALSEFIENLPKIQDLPLCAPGTGCLTGLGHSEGELASSNNVESGSARQDSTATDGSQPVGGTWSDVAAAPVSENCDGNDIGRRVLKPRRCAQKHD